MFKAKETGAMEATHPCVAPVAPAVFSHATQGCVASVVATQGCVASVAATQGCVASVAATQGCVASDAATQGCVASVASVAPVAIHFMSEDRKIEKHRNHLPHWDQGQTCQFVTFRLADSMPESKRAQWLEERENWLARHPKPWSEDETAEYNTLFGKRLQKWLDAGYGSCILGGESARKCVWDALLHFDGERYDMYAFVVMPNHVHALFQQREGYGLGDLLHSWKSWTGSMLNKISGKGGNVWQRESWDTLIRSQRHFNYALYYIRSNPGRGGGIPVYVSKAVDAMEATHPCVAPVATDAATQGCVAPEAATQGCVASVAT